MKQYTQKQNTHQTPKGTLVFGVFIALCFVLLPSHSAYADLTMGLVGHWTFDGKDTVWTGATTGTTQDTSGNGNTGTLTNMNRSSAPVTGKVGQGIKFVGTDDVINVAASGSLNTVDITLAFWMYPRSTYNGDFIIKKTNDITGYLLWSTESNSRNLSFRINGVDKNTPDNIFELNKWQYITVTNNGATTTFYVNGVSVYSVAQSGTGSHLSHNLYIGGDGGSSSMLGGSLDDVRIYNRALSATEIQQLYKQGGAKLGVTAPRTASTTTGLSSGLVGHWTFDGKDTVWTSSTAGTARDTSGYGNTGTFTNMNRSSAPVTGKVGQGLNFTNGSNQVVSAGSGSSITDLTQKTITAWVKTSSLGQSSTGEIMSKFSGAGLGWYLDVANGSTGKLRFHEEFFSGGTWDSDATMSTGEWHFVVVTYDRSSTSNNPTFYIDGITTTQTTVVPPTAVAVGDSGLSLRIGNNSTSGKDFDGKIDEARLYNRILSATEIQQLYKQGATKLGVTPTRIASSTGLASGLIGHWTLDGKDTIWTSSTTATTLDTSGYGNTGTLTSMNRSVAPSVGKVGQALKFNGSTNYVDLGTPASLDQMRQAHTVSAWVKTNISNTIQGIFSVGEHGCCGVEVDLSIQYNGGGGQYWFQYSTFNGGAPVINSDIAQIKLNTWYHVAGTYDGSTMRMYVNGVLQSSTVSVASISSLSDAAGIGAYTNGFNVPLSGAIDDVRAYNRALSASEIAQLYKLGQSRTR